jgi:hypothetical protein
MTNLERSGVPERPKIRIVIGPPRGPGEIGLNPPMAIRESRAWCEHVGRMRLEYYRRQVAAFKIHN